MRNLILSGVLLTGLGLGGCSTIWTGVSDFAGFMAEETKFLSLRKSSAVKEVVQAPSVDAPAGVYATNVGHYVPSSSAPSSHSTASYGGSMADCPEGSFLTAQYTCQLSDSASGTYFPEYRSASLEAASLGSSSAPNSFVSLTPDCPKDAYLTPENTCMQYETEGFSPLLADVSSTSPTSPKITIYKPLCPNETYLDENEQCRASAELIPTSGLRGPISYGASVSCPFGTYKDPDNICMRILN